MPMRWPQSGVPELARRPRADKPAADKAAGAFREQISSRESFAIAAEEIRGRRTCVRLGYLIGENRGTQEAGMGQVNDSYHKRHKITRWKLLSAEAFLILRALRG